MHLREITGRAIITVIIIIIIAFVLVIIVVVIVIVIVIIISMTEESLSKKNKFMRLDFISQVNKKKLNEKYKQNIETNKQNIIQREQEREIVGEKMRAANMSR